MGFSTRQPDNDADSEQDPLSSYSAPTIRRSTDRGSTQPLDDDTVGMPRGSGMEVDGTDFATRSRQRRQRQVSAGGYSQRLGEVAQNFDNRSLFLIAGVILVLLAVVLGWRILNRDGDPNASTDPAGLGTANPAAEPTAGGFQEPTGGAFSTTVPVATSGAFGVDPSSETPPEGSAGVFVVAGTGTEGLFLRADASTTGNVLGTLPEGTEVEALGEESNDGTRTWRRVRTEQGEGWVAADFIIPKP